MVVISYLGGKNVKIKIKPSKFDKKISYKKKFDQNLFESFNFTFVQLNFLKFQVYSIKVSLSNFVKCYG